MARSYLNLVNDVLTRLRETAVTSVSASPYSLMIGAFVNDAKREVEDAWQWSTLLDSITYSTVVGTNQYQTDNFITGATNAPATDRARLYLDTFTNKPVHLIVTTNKERNLEYEPTLTDQIGKQIIINQNQKDVPISYQISNSTTINTGQWSKVINLYPIPNDVYTCKLYIVNARPDLTDDADLLLVPPLPVVYKAYLYALYERGEELGESLDAVTQRVEDILADAITLDQQVTAQYQQFAVPYGAQY